MPELQGVAKTADLSIGGAAPPHLGELVAVEEECP